MTPQYILRKSLCREPHCADKDTYRRSAECEIDNLGYASEYGEPGYDAPTKGVLFANWNYFPRGIDSILERAGFAIEWSDEWTVAENGKAYRTSPDSHGWKPSIVYGEDCQEFCRDDVGDYIDDYIAHLIDSPRHADMFDVDWTEYGFENMNGVFESGFHPGQNDDPKKILTEYQQRFPSKEFLFQIPSVGQFDISFTIWGRDKQD